MFLTAGSLVKFTSLVIAPELPSSMKTAYPVIGHPPSSSGSFQPTVMEDVVEVILKGALKLLGSLQELNVNSLLSGDSPLKFSATSLNLYLSPVYNPVIVLDNT